MCRAVLEARFARFFCTANLVDCGIRVEGFDRADFAREFFNRNEAQGRKSH